VSGAGGGAAGGSVRSSPGFVAEGALAADPEVVAAITAAVELCWPRALAGAGHGQVGRAAKGGPEYVWRFSGRWWNRPVVLRRDRPWSDR
jgi:hypothetical protein